MFDIFDARAELYERGQPTRAYLDYVREHRINSLTASGFAGSLVHTRILMFDGSMFDFADEDRHEAADGLVCEAIGEDGETVEDLVAWPADAPARVLTMFGRASMLGLAAAKNHATYSFGKPLVLHRTPLDWLKAECKGAAIVSPQLAARVLLDIPGQIAPRDHAHARQIDDLMKTLSRNLMVLPRNLRGAA